LFLQNLPSIYTEFTGLTSAGVPGNATVQLIPADADTTCCVPQAIGEAKLSRREKTEKGE